MGIVATGIQVVGGLKAKTNLPPVWLTASGSLGTFDQGDSVNVSLSGSDPDGDPVNFSVSAGALPDGLTLNSSSGAITGTAPTVESSTESSFTVRIRDKYGAFADRVFTLTVQPPPPAGWKAWTGSADGTPVEFEATGTNAADSASKLNVVKVDDTRFVVCWTRDNNVYLRGGSVSGSTITFGTTVTVSGGRHPSMCQTYEASNRLLLAYQHSSNVRASVVTLNTANMTITVGTPLTVRSITNSTWVEAGRSTSEDPNASVGAAYYVIIKNPGTGSSVNHYTHVCYLSGTTTVSQVGGGTAVALRSGTEHFGAAQRNNTYQIVAHSNDSLRPAMTHLTFDGNGTATYGPYVTFDANNGGHYMDICQLANGYNVAIWAKNSTYIKAMVRDTSGVGANGTIFTISSNVAATDAWPSIVQLDATHLLATWGGPSGTLARVIEVDGLELSSDTGEISVGRTATTATGVATPLTDTTAVLASIDTDWNGVAKVIVSA